MRNVFVPSREWGKKVKSTKTANGYTKTFLKSRAHYSLVLSNCRLATFHREVNNRRYRVFLEYRLTKLERVSQQNSLPQYFVQSCLKVFCINAPMPRGRKAILFVFISHSLLRVLGELESANFGFWVVFLSRLLWTWNQNSFKFPAVFELANSDVKSFISDNYATMFPTALRLWRMKNSDFNIPISPKCFFRLVWNFRTCLVYT